MRGMNRIAEAGAVILLAATLILTVHLDGRGLTHIDITARGLGTKALELDPEGRILLAAHWNTKSVAWYDLPGLSPAGEIGIEHHPYFLMIRTDLRRLHILSHRDPRIAFVDLESTQNGIHYIDGRRDPSTFPVALATNPFAIALGAVHWSTRGLDRALEKKWYEIYLPNYHRPQSWFISIYETDTLDTAWRRPARKIEQEESFHEEYEGFWRACIDHAGTRIFVTCSITDRLYGFDLSDNARIFAVETGPRPMSLVIDEHNSAIVVANSLSDRLTLHSIDTGERIGTIDVGRGAVDLAMEEDRLYVLNRYRNRIDLVDTGRSQLIGSVGVGNIPSDMVLDSISGLLYVAHEGEDRIWVVNSKALRVERIVRID